MFMRILLITFMLFLSACSGSTTGRIDSTLPIENTPAAPTEPQTPVPPPQAPSEPPPPDDPAEPPAEPPVEPVPAPPVVESVRLEATRIRPGGGFVSGTALSIIGVWIPENAFLRIDSANDENINMNGQWAKLVVGQVTICYQAKQTGSLVNNREFDFKRAVTNMVGDCSQNSSTPTEYLAQDYVAGSSAVFTLLNSGKIQNQHVTSTAFIEFDALK